MGRLPPEMEAVQKNFWVLGEVMSVLFTGLGFFLVSTVLIFSIFFVGGFFRRHELLLAAYVLIGFVVANGVVLVPGGVELTPMDRISLICVDTIFIGVLLGAFALENLERKTGECS